MWKLNFISEQDFKDHVQLTIQHYGEKLSPYDLNKFNTNIIDPIKLIFDKIVYRYSWEEIINNEVFRQRDKSNNNDIGYFHQRIFQYIDNCEVPPSGWDVIFTKDTRIDLPNGDTVKTIYVEMKNKHNTMNSASSSRIYMKMQSQLLNDDDCACCLVETIARQSQDIPWAVTIDGARQSHRRIRRISMDKYYELVTGEPDAFYKMCSILPSVIESVMDNTDVIEPPQDTVFDELNKIADAKNGSIALALYMLGFNSYTGF